RHRALPHGSQQPAQRALHDDGVDRLPPRLSGKAELHPALTSDLCHVCAREPRSAQTLRANERSCFYCLVTKGAQTREAVLAEALDQASLRGLNGLTIGTLADRIGMSKSGLFAHFRSKDQLQVDTLDHAADRFRTHVVLPALREPAGEPRLRTLVERWLGWDGDADYAAPGGCVCAAGAMEFDDLPESPVRDRIVAHLGDLLDSLATVYRSGVRAGAFRDDVDPEVFARECYGIVLGHHVTARLLREPRADERALAAFERLLASVRTDTSGTSPTPDQEAS